MKQIETARSNSRAEDSGTSVGARILWTGVTAALLCSTAGRIYGQTATLSAPIRLDRPLTASESCVVAMGTGPHLQVPKTLFPQGYCDSVKQPVPVQTLSMAFWFPDMKQTDWPGEMDIFLAKQRGDWVPQTDRFRVWINFLFYPAQVKNATYEDWEMPERQVWQMIERARHNPDPDAYKEPIISSSTVDGLREIKFGPEIPQSPEYVMKAKKNGWYIGPDLARSYVESPGSPYSLLMHCDGGFVCIGSLQITSNKLQYRFYIPIESLPHTKEVIIIIDRMIQKWIIN
jgi:hypothetical protein